MRADGSPQPVDVETIVLDFQIKEKGDFRAVKNLPEDKIRSMIRGKIR
jgi:hypothetical protein